MFECRADKWAEGVIKVFESRADKWDEVVKLEAMLPLHQKGDRIDRDNDKGVCLLSMCSRELGRVIGKRLGLQLACASITMH